MYLTWVHTQARLFSLRPRVDVGYIGLIPVRDHPGRALIRQTGNRHIRLWRCAYAVCICRIWSRNLSVIRDLPGCRIRMSQQWLQNPKCLSISHTWSAIGSHRRRPVSTLSLLSLSSQLSSLPPHPPHSTLLVFSFSPPGTFVYIESLSSLMRSVGVQVLRQF